MARMKERKDISSQAIKEVIVNREEEKYLYSHGTYPNQAA